MAKRILYAFFVSWTSCTHSLIKKKEQPSNALPGCSLILEVCPHGPGWGRMVTPRRSRRSGRSRSQSPGWVMWEDGGHRFWGATGGRVDLLNAWDGLPRPSVR